MALEDRQLERTRGTGCVRTRQATRRRGSVKETRVFNDEVTEFHKTDRTNVQKSATAGLRCSIKGRSNRKSPESGERGRLTRKFQNAYFGEETQSQGKDSSKGRENHQRLIAGVINSQTPKKEGSLLSTMGKVEGLQWREHALCQRN